MLRGTQVPPRLRRRFRVRGCHPLWPSFPPCSAIPVFRLCWRSYNPTLCLDTRGLGSCAFARHYWRNRFLLSFPAGNEMFQFPAFAPCLAWCRDRSRRVSPFGNPRVTGYLPLHAAYRSLSRPSSPPRATGIPHAPFFAFFVSFAFYQNLLSVHILLLDSRLFSLRISYDVAISLTFTSHRWLSVSFRVPSMSMISFSLSLVVPGRLELPTSTLSV